jgi:hypothetical protein
MNVTSNLPSCFLSYSWDTDEHKAWVIHLAKALVANGVLVHLDLWEALLGLDIHQWMESRVRESEYVLVICTPRYAEKANNRVGGVGVETSVITPELFNSSPSGGRFIPVLRQGETQEALPSYLRSRLFIDFRDDGVFDSKLEDLLRHIYSVPAYPRPPLGKPPKFVSSKTTLSGIPRAKDEHADRKTAKDLTSIRRSRRSNGLWRT